VFHDPELASLTSKCCLLNKLSTLLLAKTVKTQERNIKPFALMHLLRCLFVWSTSNVHISLIHLLI